MYVCMNELVRYVCVCVCVCREFISLSNRYGRRDCERRLYAYSCTKCLYFSYLYFIYLIDRKKKIINKKTEYVWFFFHPKIFYVFHSFWNDGVGFTYLLFLIYSKLVVCNIILLTCVHVSFVDLSFYYILLRAHRYWCTYV